MRQIFPLSPCLHFASRTYVGGSLSSITCRLVFPLLSPCTRIWSQHLFFLLLLLPRRKKARGRTEDREGRGTMPPTPAPPSRFLLFSPALPKEGGDDPPPTLSDRRERKGGRKGVEREFGDALFLLLPRFFLLRRPPREKKDTRKKWGRSFFCASTGAFTPLHA